LVIASRIVTAERFSIACLAMDVGSSISLMLRTVLPAKLAAVGAHRYFHQPATSRSAASSSVTVFSRAATSVSSTACWSSDSSSSSRQKLRIQVARQVGYHTLLEYSLWLIKCCPMRITSSGSQPAHRSTALG
jgi:hypothetical protein